MNTTGKKFGGRKAGTPNIKTAKLKEMVHDFLHKNAKDLQAQYDMLEPLEKLDFFQKVLKFAIPAQTATKLDLNNMDEQTLDNIIAHLKNNEQ